MPFVTEGDRVQRFGERYIVQTKGIWDKQPLIHEPWQGDVLTELFLRDQRTGRRIYREALIGIARKNGKSTLAAEIALYGLLASGEPGAEVYSAAASKEQAAIVFNQAKAFIDSSPRLSDWLIPRRNYIECKRGGGIYRVLSSDAALQHGLNPSLVVIDELHAHRDPELYYALTTGQGARLDPLVVSITTAGYDFDSICRQVYEHGKALADAGLKAMRAEKFYMQWYAAPEGAAIDDRKALRMANPSSWIDIDDLIRESKRLPEHVFRRLHMNQWTASEEAWIPGDAWAKCMKPRIGIPIGGDVWIGMDLGVKSDTSALVLLHMREDKRAVVRTEIFTPPENGVLDLSLIKAQIARWAGKYRIRGIVYDPWNAEPLAQELSDRFNVVEFPMNNARTSPASARLRDAILNLRVLHNGDPEFAKHVNAGETRETERGWRLTKGKGNKVIDALIALMIVFATADDNSQPRPGIGVLL